MRATQPEQVEFQDWTPDGAAVLVIKRNTKERSHMLYEARLDGSPPRSLGITMDSMRDVNVRPDGKAITFTGGSNSLEVWMFGELPDRRRFAGALRMCLTVLPLTVVEWPVHVAGPEVRRLEPPQELVEQPRGLRGAA
jgi:hypothetical protein